MPEPIIQDNQTTTEYFFREGCHITEWWNHPTDPELSIARARVEPGVTTKAHFLKGTTERYVILSGEGEVEAGDLSPQIVRPGDVISFPPDTRQRIHNHGPEDLIFLALCTPRFEEKNYREEE